MGIAGLPEMARGAAFATIAGMLIYPQVCAQEFVEFKMCRLDVAVLRILNQTISEGTIDAVVLMVSCQVSEKWNQGPSSAQIMTIVTATMNAHGDPTALAVELANDRKKSCIGTPPFKTRLTNRRDQGPNDHPTLSQLTRRLHAVLPSHR